jgi:hypothetical protein
VAFAALLNFPLATLTDRLRNGAGYSRTPGSRAISRSGPALPRPPETSTSPDTTCGCTTWWTTRAPGGSLPASA